MERTNHTSVNYIRIVKQKLHGPNEKGKFHLKEQSLHKIFPYILNSFQDKNVHHICNKGEILHLDESLSI